MLDVGGGPGVDASWLALLGYRVRLVDPVPLQVDQARLVARSQPDRPCDAVTGDALQLDEPDSRWDAVLLMVLTDRGLASLAAFGDAMDRVLAVLGERLGRPDEEVTNQNNPEGNIFGVCPGAQVGNRYVRWGRLWVLFTDGQSGYGHGRWHLFAYYVKGEQVSGRPDPATARGIHVGSTLAELRDAYGRRVQIAPIEVPPSHGFRIGPHRGPAIDGLLSSTAADGQVTQLHGGQRCGE